MTAFLEIYLSSFWAWAGITFGVYCVADGLADVVIKIAQFMRAPRSRK